MQWEDFCMNLIEIIDVSDDVLVTVTRHRDPMDVAEGGWRSRAFRAAQHGAR